MSGPSPFLKGEGWPKAGVGVFLLLALACPLSAAKKALPPPSPIPLPVIVPDKTETHGTFRDAAGQSHPWRITQTHELQWDDAPYLPVGGSFTPHSWAEGQTDTAWAADVEALQTLKQHGVTDLYLYAGTGGLTRVPTAAVQRLLDYLDANGFQYGLEIADFPKDPLVGYTVEPSVYRDPAPPIQGPVRFSHVSGLQDAIYMLVTDKGAETLESGAAQVMGGDTAEIQVKEGGPGDVLLLYPRRRFDAGTPESHLPDLWKGYDEYRDRLLAFFSHVRLGKGFRFFLDPLTDRIGMNGEVKNLIPTADGFRLDFEAWLDKKYAHNLDALNRKWGMEDSDMPDFTTAARCIPLWYQRRGLPALYDPVKSVSYSVVNKPAIKNTFWDDLQAFKTESTRGYMNAIADALKKAVADVPVVYKWAQRSPLFSNSQDEGGYDGLGMEAYGHGIELSRDAGAYVYAQAEDAPKTTWLIASDIADAPPDQKTTPGFVSNAVLFDDWDYLKDIGARGFFAQSLQRLPSDENKNVSLAVLPDQLGWLGTYAASLQASARTLAVDKPAVLWYPQSLAGPDIGVRLLPGNVWWLPTNRPGQSLFLGLSLLGYSLPEPAGAGVLNVLWSPHDSVASARFDLGKEAVPVITSATGMPLIAPHKNGIWTIPVAFVPTVVRGVPPLSLSLDAPDAADHEAHRLLTLADDQKVNVDNLRQALFHAENTIRDDPQDAGVRFGLFQQVVNGLTQVLRPYTWKEAEDADEYTFDSLVPDPEASGGAYLSLDTDRDPPPADPDNGLSGGYHAVYTFRVTAPGRYALWMAGTPPGTPAASSFTWQVDDGAPNDARDSPTEGGAYAGKFVWSKLGDEQLGLARHTLTIQVTGRRAQDKRFVLAIDAFCITRAPFEPDGPRQPPVDTPPDVPATTDKDRHKKR